MDIFLNILFNVSLFVLLMIPGAILGRTKRLSERSIDQVGNILSDVAMPALVFSKLMQTDPNQITLTYVCLALALSVGIIISIFIISKYIFHFNEDRKILCRFCSTFSNCGFLGIPLAAAILPDHPQVVVYVSLFNIVNSLFILTLGTDMLEKTKKGFCIKRFFKILIRPITISVLLGFICSYLGIGGMIPRLTEYFTTLASLTTPLSMLALGLQLTLISKKDLLDIKGMASVSAVKLLLCPIFSFILLIILNAMGISIPSELAYGVLISTAVPTAATAPALAGAKGRNASYTSALTVFNTILCVITIPLIWCIYGTMFTI